MTRRYARGFIWLYASRATSRATRAAPGIARWAADVTDPNKVLTVEGDDVTAERVDALIRPAGYHVLGELRDEKPAAPTAAEEPASYFPLALVLFYLLAAVAAVEVA